jgi:hypothetical protein
MKINKRLNLVIPIETEEHGTFYVHSMPIAREVFARYYLVLSKTLARIYTEQLGIGTGPRVAALLLHDVAKEMEAWDGPVGVEKGLVAEIRRLTNVITLGDSGWGPIPLDVAVRRSMFDQDDLAEVENAITFFILTSAVNKRTQVAPIMEGASQLWGGQVTSLNCTEFAASLRTSTATDNSGERKTPAA